MATSLERLARNQALFRELNERINEVVDHGAAPTESLFECSRVACTDVIGVTAEEYREVRAHPARFFVVPVVENVHLPGAEGGE